jgi:hypothetical protein
MKPIRTVGMGMTNAPGRITLKSTAVIALAAVGFLSVPALAQEQAAPAAAVGQDQANGTSETPQAPSIAKMAPIGPIVIGGPWNEFSFTSAGSLARGCAPADPGGLGCVPSSSGNSHFVGAPPWNFTAPSDGLTLTVTDAFLKGDSFQVLDMGVPIGNTSAVPTAAVSCGSDPVPCLADPTVSHGVFNLGPGPHSITMRAVTSPFGSGAAYFRVDAKRDHLICYRIIDQSRFTQHEVRTQDQFGTSTFLVLQPELLCVPASKTDITPTK